MRLKSLALASMALLVATQAAAYHIGSNVGDPAVQDPNTPARSWTLGPPGMMLCESDGPHDVRNPQAAPRQGIGGLCTVGPTKVGTWNDNAVLPSAAVYDSTMPPPAPGLLVKVDALDPATGSTAIGFDAEVGGYFCFVPPGQALYYEALYAWWSYDPGTYSTPAEEDGFHGHAWMQIDAKSAAAIGAFTGTALVDDGGGLGVTAPNGIGAAPCGSSPYGGPVFLDDP